MLLLRCDELDGLLSALYCASDAATRRVGHQPSGRVALVAVGGYGLARLIAWIMTSSYPTLIVQFTWDWTVYASLLGLLGGVLGSFYPAMRAARQDPVRALRDE